MDILNGNYKWPFSIAMLNYQRVLIPRDGKANRHENGRMNGRMRQHFLILFGSIEKTIALYIQNLECPVVLKPSRAKPAFKGVFF